MTPQLKTCTACVGGKHAECTGCTGCTGCGCVLSAQYAHHTDGTHKAKR